MAQVHGLVPGLGAWQNIRSNASNAGVAESTSEAASVVISTVVTMAHAPVVAASDPDVNRNLVFVGNKFQVWARCAVDVFQPTTGMLRWEL